MIRPRPRLTYEGLFWCCASGTLTRYGLTPRLAYVAWQEAYDWQHRQRQPVTPRWQHAVKNAAALLCTLPAAFVIGSAFALLVWLH